MGLDAADITADIYDMHEDRAGRLWFAGSDGIFRKDGDAWVHYTVEGIFDLEDDNWVQRTDQLKLSDNFIWSMHESADGVMWFGTQSRGVIGYDGTAYTRIDARDGLVGGHVMKILSDSTGALLIGTFDGGLTHYERVDRAHALEITGIHSGTASFSATEILPAFDVDRTITVAYSETDLSTKPENRQFPHYHSRHSRSDRNTICHPGARV